MIKAKLFGWSCAAALTFSAGLATAHHSYAMYDMTTTRTANATIKEFHWGAPHSSVSVVIQGENGEPQTFTLQGAAPTTMAKAGFNPKDFRRGMKVEVTWHPLRGDKLGGTLASLKFEDGRTFVDNEFGNTNTAPPAAQ